MRIDFKLPELGENVEAADVVSVLVAEGHVIQAGQSVLELETDKAVVELPCEHAGRVVKVHVQPGSRVSVGAALLTIETAEVAEAHVAAPAARTNEAPTPAVAEPLTEAPAKAELESPPPAEPTAPVRPEPEPPPDVKPPAPEPAGRPVPAGPATRRLAHELGVDLRQVSGTGPGGRITSEDVHAYVRKLASSPRAAKMAAPGAPPLPDFSQWGPIERQPVSGIRRKTAETVSLAWQIVPQVTQFDLADITELEAARKRYKDMRPEGATKLTITALTLKAVVAAIKTYPQFNASLDAAAGVLILKRYYHLGVAVDTEHGLIVPIIRDVDRKSILELAAELDEVAKRARGRKIDLEELRGATFTITNLGGIGGTAFSPIVNFPQVAILGLARARHEQVVRDGKGEVRLMLPLCLSYDHRVIDGADGARFLRKLADLLSDPLALLLEG